jgi:hypothetical protein
MRTGDVVVVLLLTVRYQGTRSMAPISQVILAQMICAAQRELRQQLSSRTSLHDWTCHVTGNIDAHPCQHSGWLPKAC